MPSALRIADRIKETSTTTGTGAFTLAGAMTGFKAFSDACTVGDLLFYTIQGVDGTGAPSGEWECGYGTYSAANTLTRTTPSAGSAATPVSFSAGTKQVFLSATAQQLSWPREKLTAARVYYVRTNGSDSNTGLANTAGGAFLTIQKAVDVVCNTLDINGFSVVISVADGTYSGAVTLKPHVGAGTNYPTLRGNTSNQSSVMISTTAFGAVTSDGAGANWNVSYLQAASSTGSCFVATNNSRLILDFVNVGSCPGTQLRAQNLGFLKLMDDHIVNGNAYAWAGAGAGGMLDISYCGVTFNSTPTYTQVVSLSGPAYHTMNGITFTGSTIGQRYNVTNNAVCYTNNAGANYFPGNSAGATSNGGLYI